MNKHVQNLMMKLAATCLLLIWIDNLEWEVLYLILDLSFLLGYRSVLVRSQFLKLYLFVYSLYAELLL
jgi:hypothetical protein